MNIAAFGAAIAATLLAASYLGALHPVADSLAVGRPLLALALVGCGWALLGPWALLGLAVVAAPMGWSAWTSRGAADLTIYQKNLSFRLADTAPIVQDIADSGADVVTLQELHGRLTPMRQQLAATYPYQHWCDANAVGRVAILSKHPFVDIGCVYWEGLAHARIAAPSGEVTVVALHLHWPYPYKQPLQVDVLMPTLAALPGPVVVAGDFNSVPGTHTVSRISRATKTRRAPFNVPTFWVRGVYPITIDHVLLPARWHAQIARRPLLGSDHRGLLARVTRG